ncbi:response regulator [Aeromicrobium duanguangcaii]|uniref:Response regulator n=1 Tax=Aeromicrobium duanguangcaii TaxID=2968086 RepID=A0ABY5KF36_9ACTN|nr:response regulator [Aeromicrobium duanguangcaii]MCD9154916.1 response regulator [Aeromicrobium duanguangcaii]MCL3839043.1 response regulator [Aeromicrobium duanguangcaii]UUI67675.1 response regulator [Aeromicrobium duanguangcaii]
MPPTVLVVDDTASIRFLIRTNLELAGFDVIEAADGQDCLDVLAGLETLPDVITMDMMMPRMDGVTAITRVRANPRFAGVGLVMVSTQSQQIDLNRAAAAGVDEYVTKPFDPDTLVATVRRVLESRR